MEGQGVEVVLLQEQPKSLENGATKCSKRAGLHVEGGVCVHVSA